MGPTGPILFKEAKRCSSPPKPLPAGGQAMVRLASGQAMVRLASGQAGVGLARGNVMIRLTSVQLVK